MKKIGIVAVLMAALLIGMAFAPTVSAVKNGEKANGEKIDDKTVLEKIRNLPGIDKNSIQTDLDEPSLTTNAKQSISESDGRCWNWKPRLIHFSFPMRDENDPLPIKVDMWVNLRNYKFGETKIDYFSPGSGLSADANANTNPSMTLIESRLVKEGYFMVVGITPSEASYDPESLDYSEEALKKLDVPDHVKDVRKVIRLFQRAGFDYDYTIEGHSAGALNAALAAVKIGDSDPRFKELDIKDMVLQYKDGTPQAEYATISYKAVSDLYNGGVYEYSSFKDYKRMAGVIRAYPGMYIDSEVPRGEDLALGNFSVEGLFYFASIHTGWMPGLVTGATGLPDNWYFGDGGYLAGNYQFMPDPADDIYSFSQTRIETMFEALDKIKYGAYPTVFERDTMAIWAGIDPIDWNKISNQVKINWRNDECGFGDVSQIDRAYEILSGRSSFSYEVRPGFCHADEVYADNAFN